MRCVGKHWDEKEVEHGRMWSRYVQIACHGFEESKSLAGDALLIRALVHTLPQSRDACAT
jgi:hypothetical protein